MMNTFKKKFIGNKSFYKMVLGISIPIMIQVGITNFVGLLDNIMIGQLGTDQMSGVAIANQLMFVFNLCIFGAISGAGIFSAQYCGQGNDDGVRYTFRFKHYLCSLLSFGGIVLFFFHGKSFINLFLHTGSLTGNINNTLSFGNTYLLIMLIGILPYSISQVYASTLRESGKTMLPMVAGAIAVFLNLLLNYLLIFGNWGFPKLGVAGAAIATIISRLIECLIIVLWVHLHLPIYHYIKGAYRSFYVPKYLIFQILKKGTPLLLNEGLWAFGMATLTQIYSFRGLAVIAGLNISTTISNLFSIVFISLGSALAIIVGQLLGSSKMEEAKDTDTKLIFFSVTSCFLFGLLLIILAPLFPSIYNTTDEVKHYATRFIQTMGLLMPVQGFLHASYFTLRSGGKTLITFIFDSVFVWTISIPVAYFLIHNTTLNIMPLYLICGLADLIKCVIGYILVKNGIWMNNIISCPNQINIETS